jgi:hypothetical protein
LGVAGQAHDIPSDPFGSLMKTIRAQHMAGYSPTPPLGEPHLRGREHSAYLSSTADTMSCIRHEHKGDVAKPA